jgi:hypothetical protein
MARICACDVYMLAGTHPRLDVVPDEPGSHVVLAQRFFLRRRTRTRARPRPRPRGRPRRAPAAMSEAAVVMRAMAAAAVARGLDGSACGGIGAAVQRGVWGHRNSLSHRNSVAACGEAACKVS